MIAVSDWSPRSCQSECDEVFPARGKHAVCVLLTTSIEDGGSMNDQ